MFIAKEVFMKTCEQCGMQWNEPPEDCPKCRTSKPIAPPTPATAVTEQTATVSISPYTPQPATPIMNPPDTQKPDRYWLILACSLGLIIVIIIAAVIGSRIYNDRYSPEAKRAAAANADYLAAKAIVEVEDDYIALMKTYEHQGYLSLDETRELRKTIDRATELRDKYQYGSEEYNNLDSFTKDFTVPRY